MRKACDKQIKTIEDQGENKVKALKTFKSDNEKLTVEDVILKNALNNDEAKKEFDKIKEIEENVDTEKLVCETNEYIYSFKNFQKKSFGSDIYEGNIMLKETDEYQADLLVKIMSFKKNTRPKSPEKNKKEKLFLKTCTIF